MPGVWRLLGLAAAATSGFHGAESAWLSRNELAGASRLQLGSSGADDILGINLRAREATHQILMVCNAYAYSKPLHIYNVRSQQRLTGKEPLAYKECGDYSVWLREGDQLEFRTSVSQDTVENPAGEYSVGIFRAWGLPKSTASLLLVPHRQGDSQSIAFESHVFRELQSAQLAVVNAYHGDGFGKMRIVDDRVAGTETQLSVNIGSEELSFNSVIALNPGKYKLVLSDDSNKDVSVTQLQVDKPKQKFVIMRVGADEDLQYKVGNRTALPQELFLHRQELEDDRSGSPMGASPRAWLAPLLAALMPLAAAAV